MTVTVNVNEPREFMNCYYGTCTLESCDDLTHSVKNHNLSGPKPNGPSIPNFVLTLTTQLQRTLTACDAVPGLISVMRPQWESGQLGFVLFRKCQQREWAEKRATLAAGFVVGDSGTQNKASEIREVVALKRPRCFCFG